MFASFVNQHSLEEDQYSPKDIVFEQDNVSRKRKGKGKGKGKRRGKKQKQAKRNKQAKRERSYTFEYDPNFLPKELKESLYRFDPDAIIDSCLTDVNNGKILYPDGTRVIPPDNKIYAIKVLINMRIIVVHIDGKHGCKIFGSVERERDYEFIGRP